MACLSPGLASHDLPAVDPTEQWMAYGVVFDTDRDGIADLRYGVDNMPLEGMAARQGGKAPPSVADGPPHRPDRVGGQGMLLDVPFYAWASEIQDGRVVATDYAPNVGWLLPSPDAKP